MIIRRVKVSNFKSFSDLEVELGQFTVLIGANASGKSNFVQVFKFLRDIVNTGLDNAVSMQGGVEFVRNVNLASSRRLSMEITFDHGGTGDDEFIIGRPARGPVRQGFRVVQTVYTFALEFREAAPGFDIAEDRLTLGVETVPLEEKPGIARRATQGQITITKQQGKLAVDSSLRDLNLEEAFPRFLMAAEVPPTSLLLEVPIYSFYLRPSLDRFLSAIPIYDFDPKLCKRAVQITGKAELEEDGSNLAIVLKNIIADRDNKRKFSNLVRDLLPFVVDLDIERFADRSLLFKLRETYSRSQYLPASFLSDGTINITALIIALYFQRKPGPTPGMPLIIIEEPERNIHPYLISKVVRLLREASRRKQVIVTTHNPEIVKHASLENILLISRNASGFSVVSRPSEVQAVKVFLRNEVGVDELFVQDLLGV